MKDEGHRENRPPRRTHILHCSPPWCCRTRASVIVGDLVTMKSGTMSSCQLLETHTLGCSVSIVPFVGSHDLTDLTSSIYFLDSIYLLMLPRFWGAPCMLRGHFIPCQCPGLSPKQKPCSMPSPCTRPSEGLTVVQLRNPHSPLCNSRKSSQREV